MKTIEQQNAIIAEFMGYIDNGCSEDGYLIHPTTNHDVDIDSLQYHTSWDCLMPVIERIESTSADEQNYKFQVAIQNNHCTLSQSNLFANKIVYGATKLEAAYNAVCQFIECYNANN